MPTPAVVLDTNIFVAAGFNPRSHSARIVEAVREGRLRLVWDEATRRETQHVVERIPPLSWSDYEDLFNKNNRHAAETDTNAFTLIPDPEDRKFIALAQAVGAVLVSRDGHLLHHRERYEVAVLTPTEFYNDLLSEGAG